MKKTETTAAPEAPADSKQIGSEDYERKIIGLLKVGIIVPVLLLLVAGGLYFANTLDKQPKNTAFTIDGKNYSASFVKAMATIHALELRNSNIPKDSDAKLIYQHLKEQVVAKKLGIDLSQAAIEDGQKDIHYKYEINLDKTLEAAVAADAKNPSLTVPKSPSYPTKQSLVNEWLYIIGYHNALISSYATLSDGAYVGYSFAFDFGRRALFSADEVAGAGDKALIAKDREYAKSRADIYRTAIYKKNLDAGAFLRTIENKPTLTLTDTNIQFSAALSARFDSRNGANSLSSQVFYPDTYKFIKTQTKAGVSAVLLAKTTQGIPVAYYFVVIEKAKAGVPNVQQAIADEANNIGGKYYGL